MLNMNTSQINSKVDFINNYMSSCNAAEGSKLDANANVSSKNIATMSAELYKAETIQINRKLVQNKLSQLFCPSLASEYIVDLDQHNIYVHDETSLFPYCASVSLYPYLLEGLKGLGGESKPPKHLSSFNGGFVNLVFAISSQFAGAVATVEFPMYFDYFARKDYGENYLETHLEVITQELQQVVYALNQPVSTRTYQTPFWNISIFDREYFESMFSNFRFPDGSAPNYNSLEKLQRFFMSWFNKERTKALLTFPVVTAACLNDSTQLKDKEFETMITQELSEGNSFFIFTSPNAYALSSCCRLKNDVTDQMNDFSYSLGAGGIMTGSLNVITINMFKLAATSCHQGSQNYHSFLTNLEQLLAKMYQYQIAQKEVFKDYLNADLLPVYNSNYITMDKQYLTIGINGLLEAAEFLGFDISNNDTYKQFISDTLKLISDNNKVANKKYKHKFNTEFVPAENLGVKFSKWDKENNLNVSRDCYNSYLYKVEHDTDITDKIILHGKDTSTYLDGGSAVHLNLEGYLTAEGYKNIINIACQEGCEYFCFNTKVTVCESCGNIDKNTLQSCPVCYSTDVSHATRVIGYLKKVDSFSLARQKEESKRKYHS